MALLTFQLLLFCLHHTMAKGIPRNSIDWASVRCPQDLDTTLPTPTYRYDGAVFTVCTEEFINAPVELVYDVVIDFKAYSLWNTFVIDVRLPQNITNTPQDVYVGTPMIFTTTGLIPALNTTSDEIVTVLESSGSEGYLLNTWRSDVRFLGILLTAEHPNILVDVGNGTTRYVSYETDYSEPFVGFLLTLRGALQAAFERQGRDLKKYAEALAR